MSDAACLNKIPAYFFVSQELLRVEHDERLPEAPPELSPVRVKKVPRERADHDLHVGLLDLPPDAPRAVLLHDLQVVVHQLQETLHPRRAVLRALAVHAVRERHHQPRWHLPLRLAAADIVVDHDLRAVREVPELRLPDHQRVRVGETVPVLEPQHPVFGQVAVVDLQLVVVLRRDELSQRAEFCVKLLVV